MKIISAFIFANILFLLFLDFMAIQDMIAAKSLFVIEEGKENYRFLYTRFTGDYFNHIYLSTYSLFSVGLLLQFEIVKNKLLRLILVAYLLLHIVLLGSRAVVIAILIASFISAIASSVHSRKNIKYLLGILVVFVLTASFIYSYKDTLLMNRYAQVFEWYKNKDLLLKRDYSVNNRAKLYIVGFSMFEDVHRYNINGTGLASQEIKKKYESQFKDKFALNTITYNAHNQFINNFIDWGLIGILLLIYLLYIALNASVHGRLSWITFFWLSFCLILTMESVLIRHRGIVFFVFFITFFSFPNPKSQNEER